MSSFTNIVIRHFAVTIRLIVVTLLLILAGCGERPTPTPLPPLAATATAVVPPIASETAIPVNSDQLVVWLPAFTGLASEGSAGVILTNAFHQFEQANPTIKLDIQIKADSGTSSLFNFLRSAQEVAPTILPDVVLINTQQLWPIVDLGMVLPLDDEDMPAAENFYTAANEAVDYHGQAVGIPYAADIVHLAYDRPNGDPPPSNWAVLLESGESILFPAAETGTTNATLLQYTGAGGELLEDGTISDPAALEEFFTFILQAREMEVIPTIVLDLPGFTSTWREFVEGSGQLAMTQVAQFYPNATGIKPPSYALVPTRDGTAATIADTWAFAILTEDEERREHALALIQQLLAPEVQGPWSQAVARLPSQPQALALWTQSNEYRDFAETLLEEATVPPNGPAFADFARRLHAAQAGLIRGDLTVDEAIASMVVIE